MNSELQTAPILSPRGPPGNTSRSPPVPLPYFMRTPSTRALSALAFDRNQEFDPGPPLSPGVLEDLELVVGARAIVTDISPADRQRRRKGPVAGGWPRSRNGSRSTT